MNLFKWLTIPNGETKEVLAYESWTVRWYSRYGQYHSDTRENVEVFTKKEDADDFAEALKNAHKLLRNTSGTSVHVEKV